MPKFKKKPVIIEAMQVIEPGGPLIDWLNAHLDSATSTPYAVQEGQWAIDPETGGVFIGTLEGVMLARPGSWIIRGIAGEFYPCDDAIFHDTYEAVDA